AGTAARDDQKIQRELLDIQSVMIERHVPSSALPCSKLRLSGTGTGTFTGTFRKGIQGQTLVCARPPTPAGPQRTVSSLSALRVATARYHSVRWMMW
ncbi:MAG TPA: hypothetical protein VI072_15115, partial [Polyangiaceae bacterium]